MGQTKATAIEFSAFQPIQLRQPKLYGLINGLLSGILIGASSGLFAGSLITMVSGLSDGMYYGSLISFLSGLWIAVILIIHNFIRSESAAIATQDIRIRKWSNIFTRANFFFVTFFSCVIFLAFYLIADFSVGLAFLIFFLISFLDEQGTVVLSFSAILEPYQRLRKGFLFKSLQIFFIFAVIFLILYVFSDSFRNSLLEILNISVSIFYGAIFLLLFFSFFFGFIAGLILNPIYNHLILRFCFYLEGSMPLKYVDFLNYLTELRILESDGGQWRFRHQTLQKYFVDLKDQCKF